MDGDALRLIQEPLKAQYREHPDAARVTLRARGALGEGVSCNVETGRAMAEAGLHPATGGDGTQLCSGDMLLEALAACAGVTLRAVATSLGIEVRGGTVEVEGDLDFRGTLSVDREARVGFTDIRVRFSLDADASQDELDTLLRLTERYCVVGQTLAASPTLRVQPVVSPAVANTPKRPNKRRVEGGRVTPKGGPTKRRLEDTNPDVSSRYTPPVPISYRESPPWVPIIMFTFFGIGMVVIFLHYVDLLLPGASSNWWLFAGLGSILAGIITATQYR